MTRTSFGLAVRASASNPDTARVYGISVKRTSTIVWTIAAAFAAITGDPGRAAAGRHARQHRRGRRRRDRPVAAAARARRRAHRPHAVAADDASSAASPSACSSASCSPTSTRATSRSSTSTCSSPRSCSCCSWSASRRDDAGWSLSAQVKPIPERLRSLWYVRRLPLIGFVAAVRVPRGAAALPVAAVAGVPLDRDRDLRAGRAVDHAARRLGRPAVARAVRVRRARRADDGRAARRPRHPGAVRPLGHAVAAGVAPGRRRRDRRRRRRRARHRRPGAARPRPVPRGDHARVRGDVLELAVPPAGVDGSRVRHDDAAHRTARRSASIDFSNRRSLYYLCFGGARRRRRSSSPGCAAPASAAR